MSPTLISQVTEQTLEQVQQWQSRPLGELYPIVYLDCIMVWVYGSVKKNALNHFMIEFPDRMPEQL